MMDRSRTRVVALSFQASYRCRHSGACCTAGWPIPVEPERAPRLREANPGGIESVAQQAEGVGCGAFLLAKDPSGACAFHDASSRRCLVHLRLGREHLPTSCAHFPRRLLIEEDRIAVSLSHFCPTVAGLLFTTDGDGAEARVVEAPSLLDGIEPEGLDARGEWPPLLRKGVLADHRSYRLWEQWLVETLAAADGGPEAALERARAVTDDVARWKPGSCALEEWVAERTATRRRTPSRLPAGDDVPGPLWRPAGRYLAARAFASWAAYQGEGLHAVVGSVEAALASLKREAARLCASARRPLDAPLLEQAARQSDLRLLHGRM